MQYMPVKNKYQEDCGSRSVAKAVVDHGARMYAHSHGPGAIEEVHS